MKKYSIPIFFSIFLLGAMVGHYISRFNADPWQEYWGTRMRIIKLVGEDPLVYGSVCEENVIAWNKLIKTGEILPVFYKIEDFKKFHDDNNDVIFYRCGTAIEGGQWAPGHEYVDKISYNRINSRYKKFAQQADASEPASPAR